MLLTEKFSVKSMCRKERLDWHGRFCAKKSPDHHFRDWGLFVQNKSELSTLALLCKSLCAKGLLPEREQHSISTKTLTIIHEIISAFAEIQAASVDRWQVFSGKAADFPEKLASLDTAML